MLQRQVILGLLGNVVKLTPSGSASLSNVEHSVNSAVDGIDALGKFRSEVVFDLALISTPRLGGFATANAYPRTTLRHFRTSLEWLAMSK